MILLEEYVIYSQFLEVWEWLNYTYFCAITSCYALEIESLIGF